MKLREYLPIYMAEMSREEGGVNDILDACLKTHQRAGQFVIANILAHSALGIQQRPNEANTCAEHSLMSMKLVNSSTAFHHYIHPAIITNFAKTNRFDLTEIMQNRLQNRSKFAHPLHGADSTSDDFEVFIFDSNASGFGGRILEW
jgi:hypothetical protein